jgi:hypothetical protein
MCSELDVLVEPALGRQEQVIFEHLVDRPRAGRRS